MHDIKNIEQNETDVKENLKKRNFDLSIIDDVLKLNTRRKELVRIVEDSRFEIKNLSKEIGPLKKKGEDASHLTDQVANIKKEIANSEHELEILEKG